jgi:hypothetical protein
MPNTSDMYCSAAALFCCKNTGNIATATYCEKTSCEVASNYRGEIIGGVITTFVLHTLASLVSPNRTHTYEIFCNNTGVVTHGNGAQRPLPETQSQRDLLTLLQRNISLSRLHVKYTHVYGHLDDDIQFSELSLPQQLNVMADKLAKDCLLNHIKKDFAWGPTYPHEPV